MIIISPELILNDTVFGLVLFFALVSLIIVQIKHRSVTQHSFPFHFVLASLLFLEHFQVWIRH